MAVTVNQLCKKCNQSYGLKAVAGFDGFNNLVEWVHIMESSNVVAFLRGQELVFTT
ncbi:MAG: PucR family transcriptional regulator ligand-binding domain-containing protein, partial [Eubacterium sp.]|nr:PucR family transcriptional regulator ligand-binding domain-containing protein [Eubacterium sp.]